MSGQTRSPHSHSPANPPANSFRPSSIAWPRPRRILKNWPIFKRRMGLRTSTPRAAEPCSRSLPCISVVSVWEQSTASSLASPAPSRSSPDSPRTSPWPARPKFYQLARELWPPSSPTNPRPRSPISSTSSAASIEPTASAMFLKTS